MTHQELVLRTLEAYANTAPGSEDDIVNRLCSSGVPRVVAERLIALVPLAFGRVLISHMAKVEFPTTVVLEARDGSQRSCDLSKDRLFASALEIAVVMYHDGPRHLFQAAAIASAELSAVNQALNAGSKLEGARFREPSFRRLLFEDWTSGEAFEP